MNWLHRFDPNFVQIFESTQVKRMSEFKIVWNVKILKVSNSFRANKIIDIDNIFHSQVKHFKQVSQFSSVSRALPTVRWALNFLLESPELWIRRGIRVVSAEPFDLGWLNDGCWWQCHKYDLIWFQPCLEFLNIEHFCTSWSTVRIFHSFEFQLIQMIFMGFHYCGGTIPHGMVLDGAVEIR